MGGNTGTRWRPTLRLTFAGALSGMTLLTAAVLIGANEIGARSAARRTSSELMDQVKDLTEAQALSFLLPPRNAADLTVRHLESGVLDPADTDQLERHFFETLRTFDSVVAVNWGEPDGDFLMVKRLPDGSLATKQISHDDGERLVLWKYREPGAPLHAISNEARDPDDLYDPTGRPWFVGAAEASTMFWSEVYVFYSDLQPGISVSVPFLRDEDLVGVLAIDVSLSDFSEFLGEIELGRSGEVVLFDGKGRYVAGPDEEDMVVQAQTADGVTLAMRPLKDSAYPYIAQLPAQEEFEEAVARGEPASLRFASEGTTYVGRIKPIRVKPNREWFVALVVPENDFLGEIQRARVRNITVGGVLTFLGVLLSLLIARFMAGALESLRSQTAAIERLHLDEGSEESSFREIADTLAAFENMKTGLRAFGKYLPVELVRVLLEDRAEPELGGEIRELTLFFSDLADFTTMAEAMDTMDMAVGLGRYLETISDAVKAQDGTVVQYVGDAVMAFWGAPLPVADPAGQACRAALAAKRALAEAGPGGIGLPSVRTRIGILTAPVAVGHFGTPNRLYYGAVGDGVNTTARIETANKTYGTSILVGGETYERVADRFEARRVDCVRLKGRAGVTFLYELLGEKDEVGPDVLTAARAYEKAWDIHRERRFSEAKAAFDALAGQHGDPAARLLAERCAAYQAHPPPDDWDGTWAMRTK